MRSNLWLSVLLLLTFSRNVAGQSSSTAPENSFPLYLEVELGRSVKLAALRPGDVAEGKLARDVYSPERRVFAAGSPVRLVVDHVDRQRRAMNDHWPWVVRAFTPRHEHVPSFKEATIFILGAGQKVLQVSLISMSKKTPVSAQTGQHRNREQRLIDESQPSAGSAGATDLRSDHPHDSSRLLITFAARQRENDFVVPHPAESAAELSWSPQAVTLPAGTECRVLLLNRISSSKNHPGDVVQARLLEPVLAGGAVTLPAGSLFEGNILRTQPPRWLSRAGSLTFKFTRVTLQDGSWLPLAASLTELDLTPGSHTKVDAEGRLQGERPGLKWMLINGGVSSGIAKGVDDGTQLIIEAIVSGATDASTAGTARLASTLVSGIFMLTRHGPDVILPDFTSMNVTLTRPLQLAVPAMLSLAPPNR